MTSRSRRARAHYHYLKKPLRDFLPLLAMLVVVLLLGSICFHVTLPELSYSEAFVVTYFLIFGEPILGAPTNWVLQVFHLLLPLLGLVVVLDGIVRFSYHILRRDETGPEWTCAMCKTMNNHVILCGLGKLGLRTLEQLLVLGEVVAVLEKDPQCPNLSFARKKGVPVRVGHSREEGIFEDLNIRAAKSIILCTNDDLANLEMALDARKIHPGIRVIMRMFDQELAGRLRNSLDMPLTFSTSELAAPLFATSSSDHSIVNSFYVGDQLMVIAKLAVRAGSQLVGKAIRELGRGDHVFVLSHARGGKADLFPSAEVVFAAGDEITLQTEPGTLKRIHGMNGEIKEG